MSVLTKELKRWGFLSGIENTLYYLDTGKYTTLFIERCDCSGDVSFLYDFYKQTFYHRYPNQLTFYGIQLTVHELLLRVEQYSTNRESYVTTLNGGKK